jgi:hypothetical protein
VSLAVGSAGISWDNWFHSLLLVAVTAVGLYMTVLKNVLGNLEEKTSFGGQGQVRELPKSTS